jgi:hypothetical protein
MEIKKEILLFEEFRLRKTKKIKTDILDHTKMGIHNVLSNLETIKKLERVLSKLKDKFGIKGKIKYLNSGMTGMAFECGDYVIKLTSNPKEIKQVKSLVGKKIPNCINYHQIVEFPKLGVYGILMDKCVPLNKEQGDFIWDVICTIDANELGFGNISWGEYVALSGYVKGMVYNKKLFYDFKKMCKSLVKNGISLADLHDGNIGYIGDEMVHYDIMTETSNEDISKVIDEVE